MSRRSSGSLRALCAVLVLLCAASLPQHAEAASPPPVLRHEAGDWRRLGSGEMRWFGLRLYEAALWVSGPGPWRADDAYALAIRYARDIAAERLVQASLDEMRRLGVADEARLARWRAELERAFPAVEAGDVIVGVHRPGEGAAFYHRDRLTAEVRDAAFARAFFAIWLDERTREPALRGLLLGDGHDG